MPSEATGRWFGCKHFRGHLWAQFKAGGPSAQIAHASGSLVEPGHFFPSVQDELGASHVARAPLSAQKTSVQRGAAWTATGPKTIFMKRKKTIREVVTPIKEVRNLRRQTMVAVQWFCEWNKEDWSTKIHWMKRKGYKKSVWANEFVNA